MRVEKSFKQLGASMPAGVLDGLPSGCLELRCSRLWRKGLLRAQPWKNSTYRLETAQVILHRFPHHHPTSACLGRPEGVGMT